MIKSQISSKTPVFLRSSTLIHIYINVFENMSIHKILLSVIFTDFTRKIVPHSTRIKLKFLPKKVGHNGTALSTLLSYFCKKNFHKNRVL